MNKLHFGVLSLLATFSLTAQAADERFSVGLSLGYSDSETSEFEPDDPNFTGVQLDGDSLYIGARAGYSFSEYFSVELVAQDYGEYGSNELFASSGGSEVSYNSIDFGPKGVLPLNAETAVFASAGASIFSYDVSFRSPSTDLEVKFDDKGIAPYVTLGVEHALVPGLILSLTYKYSKADLEFDEAVVTENGPSLEGSHEVSAFAASVDIRF